MYQLKNLQHDFDVEIGHVATTVRMGDKWLRRFDREHGLLEVELWECDIPHNTDCPLRDNDPVYGAGDLCLYKGTADIIGVWYGKFKDIPEELLNLEHELSSRNIDGLKESLERGYRREIEEDEDVSVLIYYRKTNK